MTHFFVLKVTVNFIFDLRHQYQYWSSASRDQSPCPF